MMRKRKKSRATISNSKQERRRDGEERWRASKLPWLYNGERIRVSEEQAQNTGLQYTNPGDTTGITALDESLHGCENGS
ncbi:unnamed protein product [Sphagnum troendelagicum]|uniref:Uncharacterized protein n=1 Tax=Sphagnum troendelagicum TaxID=128251 RepID=A0ABP0U1U5_9BRYO